MYSLCCTIFGLAKFLNIKSRRGFYMKHLSAQAAIVRAPRVITVITVITWAILAT